MTARAYRTRIFADFLRLSEKKICVHLRRSVSHYWPLLGALIVMAAVIIFAP